ncbi:hypothetical protein NQ176_g6818 [Zarea fungicola]|uniref:Uncharacterized protein n=1 Tax=Zarea fungicola TaxID=93591 RepID=A0ACC1N191_9HYPO|nr:hypothetical protein NQ176_g6818 [Lecanicillium fungicola]
MYAATQWMCKIAHIKAAELGSVWTTVEQIYRCNVNKVGAYSITVLISAVTSGHSKVASIPLGHGAEVEISFSDSLVALIMAADTATLLLSISWSHMTPTVISWMASLRYAAMNGRAELVAVLLEGGANVNDADNEDRTAPMHVIV